MERRTRASVPWGGIDEFDRFAAALGATLPRITDKTTGSGGADSEGNTEYLEAEQSDSEPDEGLRTPVARSPLTGSSGLIRIDMAGVMRICHEYGRYKYSRPGNMDATIVFESWIMIQD